VVEFLPAIEPGLERKAFMAELRNRLEPATDRLVAEARRQIEHDKHLLS
jgi:1-acyl-sn-glycerol-3-phosphate acyltransferase